MGSAELDGSSTSTGDSGSGRLMLPNRKESSFSVEDVPAGGDDSYQARARRRRRKKLKVCVLCSVATVILFALLIVILGFTVFKPQRPVSTVESIRLEDVDAGIGTLGLFGGGGLHLNLSLGVNVSVYNPNRLGRFRYDNISAVLLYRGEQFGEAPIPGGRISPRETVRIGLTLVLMADQFFSNSRALAGDLIGGSLPLSAAANITGKVTVFGIIKVPVQSQSRCNFTILLSEKTVSDQVCNYKTKLK